MSGSKVVQFSEIRREKKETLRRDYERVLFNRILGCYTVIEKLGLKSVEMRDISKSGCSFRMPTSEGAFKMDESIDFLLAIGDLDRIAGLDRFTQRAGAVRQR